MVAHCSYTVVTRPLGCIYVRKRVEGDRRKAVFDVPAIVTVRVRRIGPSAIYVSDIKAGTGCKREGICNVPALPVRIRVRSAAGSNESRHVGGMTNAYAVARRFSERYSIRFAL